ncbi:hypothetical protein [Gordonia insulae]|uniref:Uncharacterized protein n=1 Tax=Gordonia insulae TaxID=2420509 RepID=A0A3G8JR53_9ACTN|nr:hypothetical protein [Gordonia insulae]AZG47398.1 hypothetical protein D7316_04007 [Gordonia insulae]
MPRIRVWSVAVLLVVIAVITAASAVVRTSSPSAAAQLPQGSASVAGGTDAADGVLVSRTLFRESTAAIVVAPGVAPDSWRGVADLARTHRVPVFALDDTNRAAVAAELSRLGTTTVYAVGDPSVARDVGVGAVTTDTHDLSGNRPPEPTTSLVYLDRAGPDAEITAAAAGARVVRVPVADPRSTGESVRALRENPGAAVRAFGADFGSSADFAARVQTARSQTELPGGGQLVFPGRRLVALYGSPGSPSLGPLGAQDLPASVDRVKRLAAQYQPVSREPVVPAFEIIVSVASSEPGPDNSYSSMIDPGEIRRWVQAARAAGIYVTLDLQPGRTDFLTQAKRYADLLAEPNVGLALDPEWRLKPDQVHLSQIGSVSADEVNRTSEWLAGLVRARGLPQKTFVLHQFDSASLENRDRIITSRPELQVVLHADGHGTPPVKLGTWQRLISGLPPNIWMGWKNFYTEDHPTFPPSRTMQIQPTPWFVSYQ